MLDGEGNKDGSLAVLDGCADVLHERDGDKDERLAIMNSGVDALLDGEGHKTDGSSTSKPGRSPVRR